MAPETPPRRVAIVTGGGRGIGRASALRLAQAGRDIVIADIGDFGEAVVPEIERLGRRALFIKTDVADRAQVEAMVARTLEAFGRIDILVNCAGILGVERPFLEQPDSEWERVLAVNLHGVYYCCRAVLPHMLRQRWGRIVTISSGARRGAALLAPYAVSKGAVVALMRSIANCYAKDGVLANCVEPGRALTDMVIPRFSPEHLANPPGVAIGRYADPDEVAVVVTYLCSEENTYTVGAVWRVAGTAG
jgi:NAD(P)-dependent dehydrogenase (short-subunit alcohol dehydrogenase family)